MRTKNFYTLQAGIKANLRRNRFLWVLFMAGILFSLPSTAQTYYKIDTFTTPTTVGGVNVTVTNASGGAFDCGGTPAPFLLGNGTTGNYTYTFATPVSKIRVFVDQIGSDPLDTVKFMINGVQYPLTPGNVSALNPFCTFSTLATIADGSLVDLSGSGSSATVDIDPGFDINSFSVNTGTPTGDGFVFGVSLATVPTFTGGPSQPLPVCQDAIAVSYNSLLQISDGNTATTLNWNVLTGPINGTLGTPGFTAPSNGGLISPTGQDYTPTPGFSGLDSFSYTIDDNLGGLDTITILVTVNPTPSVTVTPSSQTVCNGSLTSVVNFTSTAPSTTFTWVNDNVTIGLPASGAGDSVDTFTAINVLFIPAVATITVTPTANDCAGPSMTFTYTVNPTPDVFVPANMSFCNGDVTTAIPLAGDVPATTFDWTNDSTSIGLAASGTDVIPSFTATNSSTDPAIATISITPTANTCVGAVQSFTITVNPIPVLTSPLTTMACSNTLFIYPSTSATAGTTFGWSRDAVTGISNPANSGVDTIKETLNDTTNAPVVVIYMDTLKANGCSNVQSVSVTVNPLPTLSSPLTGTALCNGTFMYTPTSDATGSTVNFTWSRDTVAGITPGSALGTGDVNEVLTNSTPLIVPVQYVYTLEYVALPASCFNTQTVTVQVLPVPVLTGVLSSSVCDSTLFSDTLTSATPLTTFSWTRDSVTGISNGPASGLDTIREYLNNTTTASIPVTYVATLMANGCTHTESITVTVTPIPMLTNALTATICDSNLFSDTLMSTVPGTAITWSRAFVPGIANVAASGTDVIHEYLVNSTTGPIPVTYVDTLKSNGCVNIENIVVTVNPKPLLSSAHSSAICNGQTFNYTPTSGTTGTTFTWSRGYVPGIGLVPGSGTGNPNEQITNNTNVNINVVYVFTLTANGCTNTDDVIVAVRPTPELTSDTAFTICSGTPVNYLPISSTPLVSFAWSRSAVTGITPATSASTGTAGTINETLTNASSAPVTAVYVYTLNINSCTNTQNVSVTLVPAGAMPSITIAPPHTLCSNTLFQNFGAATPQPANTVYKWTATNAFVWAVGNNRQNSIVSFNNSGAAHVTLTATSSAGSTNCVSSTTYDVNVTTDVSPTVQVFYANGQFIALPNSLNSYQWGFDDAFTLDSTLVPGEVNQTYFHGLDDIALKNYWVMTTLNGCLQKTYYNVPLGVTDINTSITEVKVYPNPASSYVNIDVVAAAGGDIQLSLSNMVGQKLDMVTAVDHKAKFDVASLPAGFYIVDCYRDGVKIGAAKFVKN